VIRKIHVVYLTDCQHYVTLGRLRLLDKRVQGIFPGGKDG